MESPKVWFHLDMDAFYAAIEQRDNPEYRGKPLIIGGNPQSRGVVSTASYEARKFGVHSAMPTSQAYRLCPQGIFIPPRMDAYLKESRKIMSLFEDYTPSVQPVSIDEAYLDMTGTRGLFGPPAEAAMRIKDRVKQETGLSISVGIASNRLVAKMASGIQKPDGLTEVLPGEEKTFVAGLEIKDLWGVGKKTQERLAELSIQTVSQLQAIPEENLRLLFGPSASRFLSMVSKGMDPGIFSTQAKSQSISNEHTFARDVSDPAVLEQVLLELAHSLYFRLLEEGKESRVLLIKIRYADFSTTTAQIQSSEPFRSVEETCRRGLELLDKRWNKREPLRLLGLGFAQVRKEEAMSQGDLFADVDMERKRREVEKTVLELRKKFNPDVLKLGGLMNASKEDLRHPRKKDHQDP